MKSLKRILAVILLLLFVCSVCACSSEEEILYAKRTLAFEQARYLDKDFETVAIVHHRLKTGCRKKLNMMFCVSTHNEGLEPEKILVNDLYLLDLDTGKWYFDTIIDDTALNFDTKENALMYYFRAFDDARGEPVIGPENAQVDYLPAEEVSLVNQMREELEKANVLRAYHKKSVNLSLSPGWLETVIETADRPAGVARGVVNSLDDAIAYCNYRFPALSDDCGEIANGETGILRSGVEIMEDYRRPALRNEIASCVTYLLSDVYEIDTLAVFVADASGGKVYPMMVNMIKLDDGYWFFDPALLMNVDTGSSEVYLPEMMCASVDAYLDSIQQTFDVKCVFKISNGERMDYEVTDSGHVVTESACAQLLYENPAV